MKTNIKVKNAKQKEPKLTFHEMNKKVNLLKRAWLKSCGIRSYRMSREKRSLLLYPLSLEIELLLSDFRNQQDYGELKKYIENTLISTDNTKQITIKEATSCASVATLLLAFSAASPDFNPSEPLLTFIVFGIIFALCITILTHLIGYAPKKTFYEILIKYM